VTEVTPNWAANLKYNLKNGYKLIVSEFDNGKVNFSAIIYNSETLTLNECGIDRYSENDNNTWCRNMGWATFTVKATGKEMAFVSTHWNVIYPQPLSQADEFDAKIMELSLGGTRPVMTGGDMNTRICFPNYNRLMSHGHVHNVKYISTGLRNHVGTMKDIWKPAKEGDPWRTLDHIFATKDVECTMFMTMLENAVIDMSDHNPIMADVKF
jgi:endonuclease/exonuclease/phosphatase family metal-dependent hydrolase